MSPVKAAAIAREKSYPPRLQRPQTSGMTNTPNTTHTTAADIRRRQELQRLLPMWPAEIDDLSLAGRRHIIRALERALRAERRRGRAGHFAYNISRHAALIANYKQERAALIAFQIATQCGSTKCAQKSPLKSGRF